MLFNWVEADFRFVIQRTETQSAGPLYFMTQIQGFLGKQASHIQ